VSTSEGALPLPARVHQLLSPSMADSSPSRLAMVRRRLFLAATLVVALLLTTPIAIVVIVLVQTLYVEDVLGDAVALLGEN